MVLNLEEIIASHHELFEFGEERIRGAVDAGAQVRFAITVPANKIRFIFWYKVGNITIDVLNMRWDGVRNVVEKDLLLGTEQLNEPTRPFPFLVAKEGSNGAVVVTNTDTVSRTFELTYHYFDTIPEFIKAVSKFLGWERVI